jgi:hypothetical protein
VNVLHVLPFPGIGGTEIATRRVAEAVRPFGVQSSALLLRPAADLQAYIEEGGIVGAELPRYISAVNQQVVSLLHFIDPP